MRLYLLQHGEACAKEVDPDRPLTQKGKTDIKRLAEFLGQAGIRVSRVMHSGKLRAQQTAEYLAAILAPGIELEVSDRINPNDDPEGLDWRNEIQKGDTLVVGHLPYMAKLVAYLTTADENRPVTAYQPCSIVCLEPNDDFWRINWMIRPELLK